MAVGVLGFDGHRAEEAELVAGGGGPVDRLGYKLAVRISRTLWLRKSVLNQSRPSSPTSRQMTDRARGTPASTVAKVMISGPGGWRCKTARNSESQFMVKKYCHRRH